MILCDLTTCYSIESACFQRLKLKCDELLSNFAFNFNMRRYMAAMTWPASFKVDADGRGLHSSTFRLNLSAFCGIGGAVRGCVGVCRRC